MTRSLGDIAATMLNVLAFLTCRHPDERARRWVASTHEPRDKADQ
jgi:hypothetical protein